VPRIARNELRRRKSSLGAPECGNVVREFRGSLAYDHPFAARAVVAVIPADRVPVGAGVEVALPPGTRHLPAVRVGDGCRHRECDGGGHGLLGAGDDRALLGLQRAADGAGDRRAGGEADAECVSARRAGRGHHPDPGGFGGTELIRRFRAAIHWMYRCGHSRLSGSRTQGDQREYGRTDGRRSGVARQGFYPHREIGGDPSTTPCGDSPCECEPRARFIAAIGALRSSCHRFVGNLKQTSINSRRKLARRRLPCPVTSWQSHAHARTGE